MSAVFSRPPWGRNERVTNKPQRTSAGRLLDTKRPMNPWNLWHHEPYETTTPLTPWNLWNHQIIDTTNPMKLWDPWHHETYETTKSLTPRNLWNQKHMKPWNHLHHETYETMKPLTPRNLWNHETIDTMRPLKPWLHGTIIIWHRHLHMLISINSCTVTPSCNRTLLLLRF